MIGLKKTTWAAGAALACVVGLTTALPSSAYAAPRTQQVHSVRTLVHVSPDYTVGYTHAVSSKTSDSCAKFTGELSVGQQHSGRLREGYIDLTGTLTSSCNGTATLYINYATNGGTPIQVKINSTGPNSHVAVNHSPFKEQAKVSYNDVYIYACTNHAGYRCGPHSG